jgi:hypothetical protein
MSSEVKNNNKYKFIFILIIVFLIGGLFFFVNSARKVNIKSKSEITNFEQCKAAGYPIQESYPEKCTTIEGNTFTRDISSDTTTTQTQVISGGAVEQDATLANYDKNISLSINHSLTLPDGLVVTLKEISDSMCNFGVQCVWVGELSALFSLNGGVASFAEDIRLGTVSNKIIKMKTHTFYLGSIGNNTATLRVVYKAPVASIANGYLTGHLFLRPWCPYETKGQACQTPPGQYTGRYIVISLQSDDQKIKETTPINLYGDYQISLPAGKYVAKLAPSYIGVEQRKYFTIKSNETTILDFEVDTTIK